MPNEFDTLLSKISNSLKGKTNPKTNKPYTDSDIYAIATAQWKKGHGGKAPSHGKEFLRNCVYGSLKKKEDDKNFYVTGYVATSHPDRAVSYDENTGLEFDGDIIPKETLQKIVDTINSRNAPEAGAVSERHDWVNEKNPNLPLAGVTQGPARLVQTEDGEWAAEADVWINSLNPRYNEVKMSVEQGLYPGFSIEYETNDYSVIDSGDKLYRHLDDIKLVGYGFASRRQIANPNAVITNRYYKEIANFSKEENNDKKQVDIQSCEDKTENKQINEVKKMETIQEVKTPEIKEETKVSEVKEEVKRLTEIQIKEMVKNMVDEAFKSSKPGMETKETKIEVKEVKEYREALEKGTLSFKQAGNIINRYPEIFYKALDGGMRRPKVFWETELKCSVPYESNFVDKYSIEMGKIRIKETEIKGALTAFNSPTNAEATYYQAPAELGDFYDPVIVSQLNDATTTFGILPKEDYSGRQNIQFRVISADPTAAGYLEGDSTWTSYNVTRVKLEQDYANYRSTVEVTGQMMQAAAGANGIGDVFNQEVERATINLRKTINTHILTGAEGTYNGTDPRYILGFQSLMNTVNNLYGKARSSYSFLQGGIKDMSSVKISLDELRLAIETVRKNGADIGNLVFITSYRQERFIKSIYQKMQTQVPISARFGFVGSVELDSVPFFTDQHADNDDCFLVDLSKTRIAVFQAPTLTEFGITGDTRKAFIKMYVQLYCVKPNQNYWMHTLATS